MATRFLKVDLSPAARDFEHVALEPGVALLDRTGANYRTLKKWLGRLIAEPEWNGTEVSFFVCDEQGARPQEIRCEPVTAQDRAGVKSLREDFETLKRRRQQAKPDAKEAKLHQAIAPQPDAAASPMGPKHLEYHFFKYLDGGTWRLVWCWGYQRKDMEPAPATICTNPTCRLLFVRRHEGTRDCPGCTAKVTSAGSEAPRRSRNRMTALLLLTAFVAGGLGYMAWEWLNKPLGPNPTLGLVASPATWSGPAGSQLEYQVVRNVPHGKQEDVTAQVVAVSENPKIARVDAGGAKIRVRSPGKTAVLYYLGDQRTHATLEVKPPTDPASVKLKPAAVTLGVGTTARLQLQGDLGDGQWVDLTDTTEWEPVTGPSVSCHAGQLEGLAPGQATVVARYRATPGHPYRTAEAKITVVDEKYTGLEIDIAPPTFKEARVAALSISVVNEAREKRSALNSSLLTLEVDPPSAAIVDGENLRGMQAGKGTVKGTFGKLTASGEFTVENDLAGRFVVSPKDLRLMVGELAELQVTSASTESIRLVSSAPGIVAVGSGTQVVGRAPGKAELTVTQEAREAKVEVEVTAPDLKSLAFVPSRISVPVDRSVPVRLVGQTRDDKQLELAAEAVTWEEIPQAAIVELDVEKLKLLGRRPTGDTPQVMVARLGDLRARGQVDVVPGPLRIELTPTGPVELPEGQTTQLHAWVRYGDGTRAEIDPSRLEWRVEPADVSDLKFDALTAAVRAVKAGAALTIGAVYQGFASNRIDFRATRQDLSLALRADRSLILVGDRGRFRATVTGAPAEFSLVGAQFESSNPELLAIERNTGAYRALAPGKVKVAAQHPNAKLAADAEIEIVARDAAQLVIRPDKFKLLVNARQSIELLLVSGERQEKISLVGDTPQPRMAIARPDAVRWQPPVLSGVQPNEPFEITLEYAGKTARAVVEVVASDGEIRVVPERARLSRGQALSPRVEQQVPGNDEWQEIDPALVTWQVPDTVRWTPAHAELRPHLTPAESAEGTLTLEASHDGKKARLEIDVASNAPPSGPLAVVREPEGEELPVDAQQRYTIVVQQGDEREPAVGVKWQPAFENDYVRWDPPVLLAKRPGHEQLLTASVGDERISFATRTFDRPTEPPEAPAPPSDKPAELRIVADQPQPITLPVRSRFSSFRVEAVYPGRPPADVTHEASLRVVAEGEPAGVIAVSSGQVVAQRPGQAEVHAAYNGVASTQGLRFEVVDHVELTALSVSPSTLRLKVGERVTVRIAGFTGDGDERRSFGDITLLGDLSWSSDHPDVVKGDGPTLTGLSVGQANVTVTAAGASASIDVEVVGSSDVLAEQAIVSPRALRLKVGESRRLGRDVTVRRGEADFSDQIEAASSAPDIVRYNREDRSLEGVSPGRADVALTAGSEIISLPVLVERGDPPHDGTIVVEPSSGILVVGEYLNLRVFLVSDSGRVDRTGSAILDSGDPHVLSVVGSRITGISAGEVKVSARLPGIPQAGEASYRVVADKFTALQVEPSPLSLGVGERKSLRIEAVGPAGRRPLGDHPDLKIVASGANPEAVELSRGGEVRGVAPGHATLQVSWKGLEAPPVAVEVENDSITGLRIDPPLAQVAVNDRERFLVYLRRRGLEQLATADDDLQMMVGNTSLATVGRDLSILGLAPGTTTVTAQLGSQRASAQLTVVPDSGRDRAGDMPPGLRFIPDVLQMQLGVPGGSVRLVKVSPDGSVEDLDHQAKFDILPEEGNNIIAVNWTASGPVFVAKKTGEAEVRASLGDLTTRSPLRVVVVDPSQPPPNQGPARLQVQPDPLRVAVGKSGALRRVQLVPPGGAPIDVNYQIESKNGQIVSVEGGTQLRGVAPGQAQVTVRPLDVPPPLASATTDVTVIVEPPPSPTPKDSRLVLSGPSRATVGAPASFRVELVNVENTQNVTNEGAALVLDADQAAAATLQPGCVLVAGRPMVLTLKARYKDLISNALEVTVDPAGQDFAKLEIEAETRPLAVGERRSYKVWGYPVGRGPRQDLTRQVRSRGETDGQSVPLMRVAVEKGFDAGIVAHVPPTLIAKAPGRFAMRAEYGPIKSDVKYLEISDVPPPNVPLVADPAAVTILVGQRTPPIQVLAMTPGERNGRPVDAVWSSENETVVAPDANSPGQFIGQSAGQARLKATFGGQVTTIDVTVTGDAFEKVTVNEKPIIHPGNRFTVIVLVQASNPPDATLEYRVSTNGSAEAGEWKVAPTGPQQRFELSSPLLKRGPDDTKYNLTIEARAKQQQVVARYPLSFRLNPTIHPTVEANP